jgi:hypothetical protein
MLICGSRTIHGQNEATERGIRIKIQGKETHEMNLNSVLQPGIGSNCKKGNKERKDFGVGEDIFCGILSV